MPGIGLCAQLACIWEATARKPGNVHPLRGFADSSYVDFLVSAAAVAPVLDISSMRGVGETVWEAIAQTRTVVSTNTNLGIVLLLAPLCVAAQKRDLRRELPNVLARLDVHDAVLVYRAIRLASPGGLGQVAEQDVHEEPTRTLRDVMALAKGRDLIARQYANDFREVLQDGVPTLDQALKSVQSLEDGIILCHLRLMAQNPDTLIARKRGRAEADECSRRARAVLQAGWPSHPLSQDAFADLDQWLRAKRNSRNPGATADLVAACLFVALHEGIIHLPPQLPWAYSDLSTRSATSSPDLSTDG